MKLKVLYPVQNLKALDINLHLNKTNKNNVGAIVIQLSDILRIEFKNFIPENTRNLISNETKVDRYDLEGITKERQLEIKNIIKYSNRESVFVFMSKEDKILSVVNNYEVISSPGYNVDRNINDFIKFSSYVLNFKIEDIKKNVELFSTRENYKKNNPSTQREQYVLGKKQSFKSLYESFISKLKRSLPKISNNNFEDDGEPTKLKDLKENTYFKANGNIFLLKKIKPSSTDEENSVEIIYGSQNSNFTDNSSADLNKEQKFIPLKIVEKNEREVDNIDINDIDFLSMIKNRQSFPLTIMNNLGVNINDYDLATVWDDMLKTLNNDQNSRNENNAKANYERTIESGNYTSPRSTTYTDKSGYKVNLNKYFQKALEIPPKVPKEVKDRYETIYDYVKGKSDYLVPLLKQFANEEEWEKVRAIARFLSNNGTKAFNDSALVYISPDSYIKDSRGVTSKKRALNSLKDIIDDTSSRYNDLLVDIGLKKDNNEDDDDLDLTDLQEIE